MNRMVMYSILLVKNGYSMNQMVKLRFFEVKKGLMKVLFFRYFERKVTIRNVRLDQVTVA